MRTVEQNRKEPGRGLSVIYEITANVRPEICKDFERFMSERHIPDLMATRAFRRASFLRAAPGAYRIVYEARSRATLDAYLANNAPALRRHVIETFPEGIQFSRKEWEVLGSFEDRSSALSGGRQC